MLEIVKEFVNIPGMEISVHWDMCATHELSDTVSTCHVQFFLRGVTHITLYTFHNIPTRQALFLQIILRVGDGDIQSPRDWFPLFLVMHTNTDYQ